MQEVMQARDYTSADRKTMLTANLVFKLGHMSEDLTACKQITQTGLLKSYALDMKGHKT